MACLIDVLLCDAVTWLEAVKKVLAWNDHTPYTLTHTLYRPTSLCLANSINEWDCVCVQSTVVILYLLSDSNFVWLSLPLSLPAILGCFTIQNGFYFRLCTCIVHKHCSCVCVCVEQSIVDNRIKFSHFNSMDVCACVYAGARAIEKKWSGQRLFLFDTINRHCTHWA